MNAVSWKKILIGDFNLKRIIRSVIFIYLCLAIFAWFWSDRVLFQPRPSSYKDTDKYLKLTTDDGVRITAVYLKNPKANYTLLYSHGNAEDIGELQPVFEDLYEMGFSVLAYDYHGYGTSEGFPTENNAYQDIHAAFQFLIQDAQIPASKIIVYGRSVGSGPSVELAAKQKVAGLILESPFLSAFRTVTGIAIFPFDKFENLKRIHQIHCPILVMHGKLDRVIPFHHGKKLFRMANEPKRFVAFDKAGHNDLGYINEELYRLTVDQFHNDLRNKHHL